MLTQLKLTDLFEKALNLKFEENIPVKEFIENIEDSLYLGKNLSDLPGSQMFFLDKTDRNSHILLRINAILEIVNRLNKSSIPKNEFIFSPEDYYTHIKNKFSLYRENVIATFLNPKNRIISDVLIALGTNDFAYVSIKDILGEAVTLRATNIIISHNHPSGDPQPSDRDIEFTKNCRQILNIAGFNLLDHIIIGEEYFSFKSNFLI